MLIEIPHRRGHADIGIVEQPAGRADDMGTLAHATAGKWNIRGYDDVRLGYVVGDPVVGRIKPGGHDDIADHRIAGRAQAAIGDECHRQIMSLSDLGDFRFDRTGVGVDENGRSGAHRRSKFNDASDTLAGMHQVEALVDLLELELVGDHRVDFNLALHIPVDDLGHIGAPARTAKGRTAP